MTTSRTHSAKRTLGVSIASFLALLTSAVAVDAARPAGSSENQSVFGSHYSYLQPGRYVFRLTGRPFDTRTLHDGVYDLVVTAVDIAGHRDVSRLRFTVVNDAGA